MLIIDEPILGFLSLLDTALSIEKFSIPHVSGIHTVSGLWLDSVDAQFITWSIDNTEPKLYPNLINSLELRRQKKSIP